MTSPKGAPRPSFAMPIATARALLAKDRERKLRARNRRKARLAEARAVVAAEEEAQQG